MSTNTFRADVPGADGVTPPDLFFDRRRFVKSAAIASLMSPMISCESESTSDPSSSDSDPTPPGEPTIVDLSPSRPGGPLVLPLSWPEGFTFHKDESITLPEAVDHTLTDRFVAGTYNNYYEFLMGRAGPVWLYTRNFEVEPWRVEVKGECHSPMTFDLDDLFRFEHEERLYHFRCVERWAMNVPWVGFPLSRLLEKVDPTSDAKFVSFHTAHRPRQMPGLAQAGSYQFPYHEALRIDEAMNELTLLATGIYGEPLPKQHGAPIRLVVPWKYGYKSPKSIVSIELHREQPETFWASGAQKHEYGFLSNVNPNIPHPRWSQAKSVWAKAETWFDTPIFNGYEKYVASMYPDEPRTPQASLQKGDIAR
ncbi:MAG: protein-methionine-sulfoxide reductase catalytic subunit MsrP [Planctomycetota bacterium]|nr:protein-methionine-sulfoxide reductase catalytic subunit MsrP [Planctomycetota bacterium]